MRRRDLLSSLAVIPLALQTKQKPTSSLSERGTFAIDANHVPLNAPESSLGFGCGHPDWSAKTDKNYQLQRQLRWPEAGHTKVTKTFYKAVVNTPNFPGIMAGHTHEQSLDMLNGLLQIVTDPNATSAYLKVNFVLQKPDLHHFSRKESIFCDC